MISIGVLLFVIECLVLSKANFQENGCPSIDNLLIYRYCQCDSISDETVQTNNLQFLCDNKKIRDTDLFGLFGNLEQAYTTPDDEDRQEKTAADDSDSVLTLGNSKPKFYGLNFSSGIGTFDFGLLNRVHFKTINLVNNRKLKNLMRAQHYNDNGSGKFSFDKLVPVQVINDVTENFTIQGSPSLGKERRENLLFDQLSRFKNLRYLTLSNNGLKRIPDQAFARPSSKYLREIHLSDNRIREIGQRSFAGLPHLSKINLDGNDLSKLYDYSFAIDNTTADIFMIYLRNNRLDENSLEDKTFDGIGARVLFIYLSNNSFKVVPESVFGSLMRGPPIVFLSLYGVQLDCEDCANRWLHDNKNRFAHKLIGASCQHNGLAFWSLPPNFYKERCG